jgi:hypothetical protein
LICLVSDPHRAVDLLLARPAALHSDLVYENCYRIIPGYASIKITHFHAATHNNYGTALILPFFTPNPGMRDA